MEITRERYRNTQSLAHEVPRDCFASRLPIATIPYNCAKQLCVPLLSQQAMNEFFSQKRGYDVNLFGIVDEGVDVSGIQ